MKNKEHRVKNTNSPLNKVLVVCWNILLIAVGSGICAVAVNALILPKHFLAAGFTGIALFIHYFVSYAPVSALYGLLNIPVFAIGWRYVGKRFFFYSIAGMIIYSVALRLVQPGPVPVDDKMLAALLAGIVSGVGSGIILRSLGSAGGLDILSVVFLKQFSVSLGSTILGFNALVLLAGALFFSLENALYTLILIFVSSKTVNLVVTGLSQRKAVFIISSRWREISAQIMNRLERGVTILHGKGGYTETDEEILYTVVALSEISRLKRLVKDIDPNVFMVISDTMEVMGKRIGNQPHW